MTAYSTQTPRPYSRSNATRLLGAGAYLEKWYRKKVIRELLKYRFRVVAPSYGYDAVTVLAHALAARSLRRKQIGCVLLGWVADLLLLKIGFIGVSGAGLLAVWVVWAFAFLRRAATMQALITRLRPGTGLSGGGGGGDFPANPALTAELAEKIAVEQAGAKDKIFYGGYTPFVGAGVKSDDWSIAELLIPARPDPVAEYFTRRDTGNGQAAEPATVTPFTVEEITQYVARRLWADLQQDAAYGQQIERLTIEPCRYSRGGRVPIKRRLLRAPRLLSLPPTDAAAFRLIEDREQYHSAREYLCVRVGSWDEELVTSIFVGFDLRGNTLYSEFYPYVLLPVTESFHLVDRLPARLTLGVLLRVAWATSFGLPIALVRSVPSWPRRFLRLFRRRRRQLEGRVKVVDASEFRLGRYAVELVDTGAVTSVRELAASEKYHIFFQQSDKAKYVKIVERRLIQIIRDFLQSKNVDLAEHDRRGATILDNSTHNHHIENFGNANIAFGGRQTVRQA